MVIAWERPHPPGQLYTAAVMWPCVRVCGHGPSLLVEKTKNKITRAPFFFFFNYFVFPVFPPLIAPPIFACACCPLCTHTYCITSYCLFVCLFSSGEWRFFCSFFFSRYKSSPVNFRLIWKTAHPIQGGLIFPILFVFLFFPSCFRCFFLFEYTNGFEKCWCLLCGTESDFQWASHLLLWHFSFIPWPFFHWKWETIAMQWVPADGRAIINSYLGFRFAENKKNNSTKKRKENILRHLLPVVLKDNAK